MNEELKAKFYLHFLHLSITKKEEATKFLNDLLSSLKDDDNFSAFLKSDTLPNLDNVYTNIVYSIIHGGDCKLNIQSYLDERTDIPATDHAKIINEIKKNLISLCKMAIEACEFFGKYIDILLIDSNEKNKLREQLKLRDISPKRKLSEIRFWQTLESYLVESGIIAGEHPVRSLYDIVLLKVDEFINKDRIKEEELNRLPNEIREKFKVVEERSFNLNSPNLIPYANMLGNGLFYARTQNSPTTYTEETIEYRSLPSASLKRKLAAAQIPSADYFNQEKADDPMYFFVTGLINQLYLFSNLPKVDCVERVGNKVSVIFMSTINETEKFDELANYLANKILEKFNALLFICSAGNNLETSILEITISESLDSKKFKELLERRLVELEERPHARRKLFETSGDSSALIPYERGVAVERSDYNPVVPFALGADEEWEEEEIIIEEYDENTGEIIRREVTYPMRNRFFFPECGNSPVLFEGSFPCEDLSINFSKEIIEKLRLYFADLEIVKIEKEEISIIITNKKMITDVAEDAKSFCSKLVELLNQGIKENNTPDIYCYSDNDKIFIISDNSNIIEQFNLLLKESFPDLENKQDETQIRGLNF